MWIKSLVKIQEFESVLTGEIIGVYNVEFSDDTNHVVVRNGRSLKVIVHGMDESTLAEIKGEVIDKIVAEASRY